MTADEECPAAELFRSSLSLIDRVVARACRHAGIHGADADDFASTVKVALMEDDYAVLRAWQKRSSLATYLTVVVQRLLSDERSRARGRWEPSAAARRGGAAAIVLEAAVQRDGRPFEQALPLVQAVDASLTAADVRSLLATLPARTPRPRQVALDEPGVDEVRAPEHAEAAALAWETTRLATQATTVVRRALAAMSAEDRAILRCRFGSDMSVADISRMLQLPQRPLYRKLEALMAQLRRELTDSGIDRGSAESLIGSSIVALDFGLIAASREEGNLP